MKMAKWERGSGSFAIKCIQSFSSAQNCTCAPFKWMMLPVFMYLLLLLHGISAHFRFDNKLNTINQHKLNNQLVSCVHFFNEHRIFCIHVLFGSCAVHTVLYVYTQTHRHYLFFTTINSISLQLSRIFLTFLWQCFKESEDPLHCHYFIDSKFIGR